MKLMIIIGITALLIIYVHCQNGFTCVPDTDCTNLNMPSAVPDPENCTNFYLCDNDAALDESLTCGADKHFNGDPLDPGCIDGDCFSPICTDFTSPVCKTSCLELETDSGFIVFPGTCNSRYFCSTFGTVIEVPCENGETFDGADCTADFADACCSVCGAPICSPDIPIQDKFPDKSNCQRFYICVNEDPLVQNCPDGELFDITTNECMLGAECSTFCYNDTIITTTTTDTTTTTTDTTTTTTDTTTTTTDTTTTTPDTTTTTTDTTTTTPDTTTTTTDTTTTTPDTTTTTTDTTTTDTTTDTTTTTPDTTTTTTDTTTTTPDTTTTTTTTTTDTTTTTTDTTTTTTDTTTTTTDTTTTTPDITTTTTDTTVTTTDTPGEFTCVPEFDCALASNPQAVPDPENCENFYLCEEGAFIDESISCAPGNHFNGDPLNPACIIGDCISPICNDFTVPVCKTSCHELETDTGFIVFPGTCNSRYYCTLIGTIQEVPCDEGEYFDGVECTNVEEDACCSVCGAPICTDKYTALDKLPDKSNCLNYYICLGGIANFQKCPDGEVFDLSSNDCQIDAECHTFCLEATTTTLNTSSRYSNLYAIG